MIWTRDRFEIDTDPARMDYARVAEMITSTYWATGRSREDVEASWRNSTVQFGVYDLSADSRLVGIARVITDKITFGRLMDVFIDPAYRGRGLSRFLMECILAHPDCATIKNFTLASSNARGLYAKFGFEQLKKPEIEMSRRFPRP